MNYFSISSIESSYDFPLFKDAAEARLQSHSLGFDGNISIAWNGTESFFVPAADLEELAIAEKVKDKTGGRRLNKPFRTPSGTKKFAVFVKNDKGNIVMVRFGDKELSIKRDNPERLKNFRARFGCDTDKGPKWKAKWWACEFWRKDKSVTDILKSSLDDWDGETFYELDEILASLDGWDEIESIAEMAEAGKKRPGPKSAAQTPTPKSERRVGSNKNKEGSSTKEKGDSIQLSDAQESALKKKAEEHNAKHEKKVTLGQLKAVWRRGAGASNQSKRPGQNTSSWAFARVNTFLKMMRGEKVKDSYRAADGDLV